MLGWRIMPLAHARLAQLGEHFVYTEGVGGSKPSLRTRDL